MTAYIETVWAEKCGDSEYRIDNTPWYAYGVSWKDEVFAKPTITGDDMPDFQGISKKSGHRTVRILFKSETERDPVLKGLKKRGCSYEGSNGKLFGIDVPPGVELELISKYLIDAGVQWEHADPCYSDLYPDEN